MKGKFVFGCVALICVFIFYFVYFYDKNIFPVRRVLVYSDFDLPNTKQLRKLVIPELSEGFFALNLKRLQSSIKSLSWVDAAIIKRVWPNTVIIKLNSWQAVAYWNDNKYLNAYGEVFDRQSLYVPKSNRVVNLNNNYVNKEFKNLPKFYGKQADAIKILETYQEINHILLSLAFKVSSISFNTSQYWTIVLNNKIKIRLGRKHILDRLQRFVKAYPKIFKPHLAQAKSVDLRYKHGMAIQW